MEFYIFLFIMVSLISFVGLFNVSNQKKKVLFLLVCMLFAFLSGTRWNGPDWQIYYPFWQDNNTYDDFTNSYISVDYGYAVINFIIKQLSDDYTVLLCILAMVIIGIRAKFILAFSLCPLFSLIYWFGTYIGDIFFIRQTLAVTITLISYYFIIRKQPIPFVACTLVAASIQISVIFYLLAYYLYHKKIPAYVWCIFLVLSLTVSAYMQPSLLASIASSLDLIPVDMERVADKALAYSNETQDSLLLSYLRRLFFLPFELWAVNKMMKLDERFRGNVNLIAFGTCMFFVFANMSTTVAGRTSTPFHIYEVIVIPEMLLLFNSIYYRIVGWGVLVAFSFWKFINEINNYYIFYVPYINVLFD